MTFRGNDESINSDDRGNFLELNDWVEDLNTEIAKHLGSKALGNNKMTFPQVKKEMVKACATLTINEIIKDIGDSFYALLVDESRDNSIQDTYGYGFKHEPALSISKLRGQGYDDAYNMSGMFNVLKSIVLEENPSVFYVHYFAHQIQLVVVAVSKNNALVVNLFGFTSLIVTNCGASCKRSDTLKQIHNEKIIEMLESGELCTGRGKNQVTVVKRPGDTRWGLYYTTMIRLVSMWLSGIEVLEIIKVDGTAEQKDVARGLVLKMAEYEFVLQCI